MKCLSKGLPHNKCLINGSSYKYNDQVEVKGGDGGDNSMGMTEAE